MQDLPSAETLAETKFDLIIIGGGITGAGIFRQAGLQGLKALLLDAQDFANGTSSRSTKLIHGGIRYLQNGEWALVREGARERLRVLKLAPHLAEPIDLLLVAPNWFTCLKYLIGVRLYEFLGQVKPEDRHRLVWGRALAAAEPSLDRSRFPYGILYREYLTDDARLVIANVRAGCALGGIALSYTPVEGLLEKAGQVAGVIIRHQDSKTPIEVQSTCVVNAAGPWVPNVLAMDEPTPKSLILSKGVHVVLARSDLTISQCCLLVADDGRPVFAIPTDEVVYVGTTDTIYEGSDLTWPPVLDEEVQYLLGVVNTHFNKTLQSSQVLSSWAGLRPLITESGKKTTEISRKDEVWVSQKGLITIAGGKLTGYLKMAETVVQQVVRQHPEFRDAVQSILAWFPGASQPRSPEGLLGPLLDSENVDAQILDRLVRRYGDEAQAVLACGRDPIAPGARMIMGQVHWAVTQEYARTLEDVVYRRLRTPLYEPSLSERGLERISELLSELLGWDESERLSQLDSTRRRLAFDQNFPDKTRSE